MDAKQEGLDSELESFRAKWLSDLRSKRDGPGEGSQQTLRVPGPSSASAPAKRVKEPPASSSRVAPPVADDDDGEHFDSRAFEAPHPVVGIASADPVSQSTAGKPVSALDHYEAAMEREAQGNMGDSLKLYRMAYKLDSAVDRRYREKHFSASSTAPKPGPSAAPQPGQVQPGPPGQHPAAGTGASAEAPAPQSMRDLIASFSDLKIEPVPPAVEGMPQPPCPIASLPEELLIHILQDVAVDDVGDFARLAVVCKRFAFLVATEQRIWRRVCLGAEVGFAAMHYHYQTGVAWEPLDAVLVEENDGTAEDGSTVLVSFRELEERRLEEKLLMTRSLVPDGYSTWLQMFRSRPRIRFNGCYISIVNYIRPGQMSTNQATWGGSIAHIVTYYRYLRFFRDGTAISLLTTDEPANVVHHLTRDLLRLHRGDMPPGVGGHGHRAQHQPQHQHQHAHLPSAVMHHALRGRWRLSSALDHPDAADPRDQEGDLYVETEGVVPKYVYRMNLSLRNPGSSKLGRNRRLFWRAFWNHNRLTDDWSEFTLNHEKPFVFSRVKSYGAGE